MKRQTFKHRGGTRWVVGCIIALLAAIPAPVARAQDAQQIHVVLDFLKLPESLVQEQRALLDASKATLAKELAGIIEKRMGCWRFVPADATEHYPRLTIQLNNSSAWNLKLILQTTKDGDPIEVATGELYSPTTDQERSLPETSEVFAGDLKRFIGGTILGHPQDVRVKFAKAPVAQNGAMFGQGKDRKFILPLNFENYRRLLNSVFEVEVENNQRFFALSESNGRDFPGAQPPGFKGIVARPVGEANRNAKPTDDELQRLDQAQTVKWIRLKEFEEPDDGN